MTVGSSFQRFADAASSPAICVTGLVAPARVGRTASSDGVVLGGLGVAARFTGSTSPTGVPVQPPSANDRRPPSINRPPPRLPTKSAIIRSWSGENEAASTLPRISAR